MKAFLGVLLGVSVLANVLLAVRLSRVPKTELAMAKAAVMEKRAGATEQDAAVLRESLEAERKKVAELQARIERLETDKKVLAQDSPVAGRGEKLAAFKSKLRKLYNLSKDPNAKAGNLDADAMVEASEVMMELFKMMATRTKDPRGYADYLQAFFEVGLENDGTALSEAQSASLGKLFEELGQDLGKVPPVPAGDRLVKEIELEAAAMNRVKAVLSESQRSKLAKDNMNIMASGSMLTTTYVPKAGAADTIAKQWSASYGLDAAQLPQAKVAAQAYVDAMERSGLKHSFGSGNEQPFEYRLRSAREQVSALQVLQASMTPAQQERLRTQAMRELIVTDFAATATADDDDK